ncbi:ent-kaurene oxidase [Trichoderma harzianum]|uniref:Ent-kaurene oxidase n=1 Tax=Trichoderma harzianum TaxID=5544 RepID=A0A0F9XR01_TRIHA|nr:ent-kaurene oxidase [Trichoderma harzianum]
MGKIIDALQQALPLLGVAANVTAASTSNIFAVPDSAWKSLNDSVSGRLHLASPAGLPCFTSYESAWGLDANAPNAAQCQTVKSGLSTSLDIISRFGGYHNPTFSTCMRRGQKCTLTATEGIRNDTCFQGTVPDYYVDAQSVEDIQKSLQFAQQYKLPVTIKNTGHDYRGGSAGVNTFAIWTHNFAPDPVITENFTPDECPSPVGPVVTYHAGQIGTHLYNSLQGTGYMIVAGSCPSVGPSGGWVAGAGHGIFTPSFGLGVDNVQQMKVVLPNGTYVTANRCQNQDIFFALRGGGGGTFGVVTETTTKLHPDQEYSYAFVQLPVTDVRGANEVLVANAERWSEEGWGGVYGVLDVAGSPNLVWLGYNANLNLDEGKASLKPVTDYLEALPGSENLVSIFKTLPNQITAQNDPVLLSILLPEAGVSLTRSSRLVPKKNFQTADGQKALVDALMENKFGWGAVIASPTNYTLAESDQPGGPGESSVSPAWRDSIWHLTYTTTWDPADPVATTPEALASMFQEMSEAMDPIRAITPGAGAYQNEADVYEPDPIGSFWGEKNYARLLAIKKQLDPDNLLSCWNCIGWNVNDERHECYLNVRGIGPSN